MTVLSAPFVSDSLLHLRAGDRVAIQGVLYMARDAAHLRMTEQFLRDGSFPIDIRGQGVYYAGPTPEKPGQVIGSAGPTTSGRMDAYTPLLLDHGLKVMVGKGNRSFEVVESMIRNGCVYLGATGGVGALLSLCIRFQQVVAYSDLGPEAIRKITVEDFPAVVIIDAKGNNLYNRMDYDETNQNDKTRSGDEWG